MYVSGLISHLTPKLENEGLGLQTLKNNHELVWCTYFRNLSKSTAYADAGAGKATVNPICTYLKLLLVADGYLADFHTDKAVLKGALTLVLHACWFTWPSVLVLAGIELIFFLVVGVVLWFGFGMKITSTIYWCF